MPTPMKFRIYRNSEADFYHHRDLENLDLHYSDAWFEKLLEHGFNGFWLNVWMRRLVAFRETETVEQAQRVDSLNRLIDRAGRFGVGVWLLLNEPKAYPRRHPIWERFPSMRGAPGTWGLNQDKMEHNLICTSTDEGRDYIYENSLRMHRALPGLAGTVLITASEYPTHCYCHTITNTGGTVFSSDQEHEGIDCAICANRSPADVVSEILNLYIKGRRDAGSGASVVAWNWNWVMYAPHPWEDLLRRLDPGITVMADFEYGGIDNVSGKSRPVDEYSLIYVGPGERYKSIATCAVKHGLHHASKLQLGATHEMGTVANMPLLSHIYQKLAYLKHDQCDGIFGTWNFGNRFTINTAALGLSMKKPALNETDLFLSELARQYMGVEDGAGFIKSVQNIEAAFDFYPLSNKMIYFGPVNFALALPMDDSPLKGTPLTNSFLQMERGDKWEDSLGPFTLDEVIARFEAMTGKLRPALSLFESVLFPTLSPFKTRLIEYEGTHLIPRNADRLSDIEMAEAMRFHLPEEVFQELPELQGVHGVRRVQEWCNAWFILGCVESATHVFKAFRIKQSCKPGWKREMQQLRLEERNTIEMVLPLLRMDARLGLHLECQQYFITSKILERKLGDLEK